MSHYYLNFDDWCWWRELDSEEEPCQVPLYVDLEPPSATPKEKEEDSEPSRVIIIDI
tara:strand:- start:452 stop:622 length:171 start_codon:yes stop_codon:yes gene_type:complete